MEKIFAQRKTEVSLTDLKSLNDTGDIIKVSYNSKVLENSVEIVKTLNCSDSSDITLKSVEMDFEGNILTCKYEDITWIRDTEVDITNINFPCSYIINNGISYRITRCNSTISIYLFLTILRFITRVSKYKSQIKTSSKSSSSQELDIYL